MPSVSQPKGGPSPGGAVGGPVTSNSPDGTGIAVDPAKLHGTAGEAGRVLDDLSAVVKPWETDVQLSHHDLGNNSQITTAYQAFRTAWNKTIHTTLSALDGWVNNLYMASNGYHSTEIHSAEYIRKDVRCK